MEKDIASTFLFQNPFAQQAYQQQQAQFQQQQQQSLHQLQQQQQAPQQFSSRPESYPSPPLLDAALPLSDHKAIGSPADKWGLLTESLNVISESANLLNPHLNLNLNMNFAVNNLALGHVGAHLATPTSSNGQSFPSPTAPSSNGGMPSALELALPAPTPELKLLPSAVNLDTPSQQPSRRSSKVNAGSLGIFGSSSSTSPSKKSVPNNIKTSSTDPKILPFQIELMNKGCPPLNDNEGKKDTFVTTEDILARKHRGFGASAKVFNQDGSKDVGGEFDRGHAHNFIFGY
jgi:hypothetical protein